MFTYQRFLKLSVCILVILNLSITSFIPAGSSPGAMIPAAVSQLSSRWACTSPYIEGIAPHHEWASALSFPFPNGRIYFLNDNSFLYVLIDVIGDTIDDPIIPYPPYGDYFWLTFDVNTDALITPEVDINYTLYPMLPYAIGLSYYLGPSTWTTLNPTSAQLGASFDSSLGSTNPHRIWEMAIPLAEIGAGPGSVIRTGFRANSVQPQFEDDTPENFSNDFTNLVNIQLQEYANCAISLMKHVAPGNASPGDILTYEIEYTNNTQGNLESVIVSDALPPELKYLPGSAVPDAHYSAGLVQFNLGNLAPMASGTLRFQAVVLQKACEGQRVLVNFAWLTAENPALNLFTNVPAITEIICRPVELPTEDPPYAESEITVHPYPLVTNQLTRVCTTIVNQSDFPQTVVVEFSLANFGIGMPFTPIATAGNPRTVTIPQHSTVNVCILWVPATPGHQCIQVRVIDANQQFPELLSQRNVDVNEVLVPGQPSSFTFPIQNNYTFPLDVTILVRNNCPGWTLLVAPTSFNLAPGSVQAVDVTVTPPGDYVLGSGCIIDIEAWALNQSGGLQFLIGGIRKIDEPLIPLGDPSEPPFAEKEIYVDPYPLVTGEETKVCVTLENNTDSTLTAEVEFMLSNYGIGLDFNTIQSTTAPNPQTVTLPPHSAMNVCINFLASTPGHHCLAVKLTLPNGYVTYSYRNLDVAEILEPNVPADTPVAVANPTASLANIDLVVDNTCPGWIAHVNPTLLMDVSPNSADVRMVTLTVIPPPGLLGTDCHIDLLAYIDGRLIGGVRKIDRAPVAPPPDQPPYAETEIVVKPDPPVVGQPALLCAKLRNPTDVDQLASVTFSVADFGAGISFTEVATMDVTIPAYGMVRICIPWTPDPGGTLHRCVQIKVHQEGYVDLFSQRNVDLERINLGSLLEPPYFIDLPPFFLSNPYTVTVPIQFEVIPFGLSGLEVDLINGGTGQTVEPGHELIFAPQEVHQFYLRLIYQPPFQQIEQEQTFLIGEDSWIDVIPYANGMHLEVNGAQSAVRYAITERTNRTYLPLIMR